MAFTIVEPPFDNIDLLPEAANGEAKVLGRLFQANNAKKVVLNPP